MTDVYAFTLSRLPAIALLGQSPRYYEEAHCVENTLDNVSPARLTASDDCATVASFLLADSPTMPLTRFGSRANSILADSGQTKTDG